MDVAGPQRAALQIAELVEHEEGMVAGAAEMTVVGGALLVAEGRADARIHVEHDGVGRMPAVDPIDPPPGQIGEGGKVSTLGEPLRLEAAHLACRGGPTRNGLAADDPAHRRVQAEPVRVVDILVAGKAAEHGLSEHAQQIVTAVLARAAIGQTLPCHRRQAENVIQFPIGEQPGIRGHPQAVELQLQTAVEIEPQTSVFRFTRRVRHRYLAPASLRY